MAERDFSEIARLSERYNKDPKSRIFVQLADAYRKSSMMDEALDILNKGLQHHPDYALAHLILGKCYYDKRLYEQAKDSFKKTLSLDQQNIVALRMLAQTCATTKDEQGQIDAYKGLIAIDPFDAQAKEKLDQLEALHRSEPLHTVAMAEEYEKQGDLKRALEIYEHLLNTDPTDIGLQQRIQQLKDKINEKANQAEEAGIEKLQVETFFKPEQMVPAPGPTSTPDIPDTSKQGADDEVMQLDDFLSSEPAISETKPPEQTPAKPEEEPLDILQPFGDTPEQPKESIDILEPTQASDILEPTPEPSYTDPQTPPLKPDEPSPEPVESQEKVEEKEPLDEAKTDSPPPPVTSDETALHSIIPPLKTEEPEQEQATTTPAPPEEQKPEPVTPPSVPEKPEPERTIQPIESETPQPAELPKSEPEPPSGPPVSETPAAEEIVDLLEPIEDQAPPPAGKTKEPSAAPGPVVPELKQETSSETIPEEKPSTADATPAPSSEPAPPASPSEVPQPAETPPQPDKEKEKPKEEDFQSFQDWLSGLLK